MAGIIQVIGVAGSLAGIVALTLAKIQAPTAIEGHSKIRITVGLDSGDSGVNDAGGDMPVLTGYNNNGDKVGTNNLSPVGGKKIGDGTRSTIQIGQGDDKGQQVTGVQFEAGKDGICIAMVTVTWPGPEEAVRAWLGDIGKECDQRWYPSKIIVNDDNHEPACTWLDKDWTDGTKSSKMYIHFPSFYVQEGGSVDNTDPKHYCDRPIMEFNNDIRSTRDVYNSTSRFDGQLVVHESSRWTAREVCENSNSNGPDHVSFLDGMFCNMRTRELVPLCSDTVTENCFSTDDKVEVRNKKRGVMTKRAYSKVHDWTK